MINGIGLKHKFLTFFSSVINVNLRFMCIYCILFSYKFSTIKRPTSSGRTRLDLDAVRLIELVCLETAVYPANVY